jgi:hypothetical protein
MKSWQKMAVPAFGLLAAGLVLASGSGVQAQGKARKLFNGKDFSGWYTFVPGEGKNVDSRGIFKIEEGGVIHVSGEKFAFLGTDEEFSNYKLSVEFKWGEKRYPPRENAKRDAGILYHCIGDDKVWMESLEYQIQEGDCGDMWLTGGAVQGKPKLTVKSKPVSEGSKEYMYDPNGEERQFEGGRVVKSVDYEKPKGEWNKAEVVCKGDQIWHYTNGKLNLQGRNASITKGTINHQSEGAELYYRNITIEPLQ